MSDLRLNHFRGPTFIYGRGAFYLEDVEGWRMHIEYGGKPEEWRVYIRNSQVFHDLTDEEFGTFKQAMEAKYQQ